MTNLSKIIAMLFALGMAATGWAESYSQLQTDWAKGKYEMTGDEQKKFFESLLVAVDTAKAEHPKDAAVFVWSGIINSTYAGVKGGMGALKFAKQAKADLETSLELDKDALNGSAYTSLGTLYFKVPGWPVGFGNDKKAQEMLTTALEKNPTGIDANYFYADYLYSKGENEKALQYLDKADQAPARPDRPLADQGRHEEIAKLRAEIKAKM